MAQEKYKADGEPSERKKSLHVMLLGEQIDVVEEALRHAERLARSNKKGHLLSLICLEFLATNVFSADPQRHLAADLAQLANQRGVQLVAFMNGEVILDMMGLGDEEKTG
jgi:hypothetical protein